MGHVFAARLVVLAVGPPMFVPFMGAFVTMKDSPHDVDTEANVAIAGPLVGTIAAFAVYFAGKHYDSLLMLAISYAGFFLNLFNMLPIYPLDGGRVTAVLGPRLWLAGMPLLAAMLVWQPSPVLFLVALLALPHALRAFRYNPRAPENVAYYAISAMKKVEYTVVYLGLMAATAIMTARVPEMLTGVRWPYLAACRRVILSASPTPPTRSPSRGCSNSLKVSTGR